MHFFVACRWPLVDRRKQLRDWHDQLHSESDFGNLWVLLRHFAEQHYSWRWGRQRYGDRDRRRWLCLDRGEQRDKLADLHAGQWQRQRLGELDGDGQYQHQSAHGHVDCRRANFHGYPEWHDLQLLNFADLGLVRSQWHTHGGLCHGECHGGPRLRLDREQRRKLADDRFQQQQRHRQW